MPVLSRLSGTAGFKEVFTPIEVSLFIAGGNPSRPILAFFKTHSAKSRLLIPPVQAVMNAAGRTKVVPSVVAGVSVFVINLLWRLLSGHKEISNPMTKKLRSLVANHQIPQAVCGTSFAANWRSAVSGNSTNKITRIGSVFQDIFDGFGYKFRSHSDTSYVGLVRGLTVSAVSTPILSQEVFL